MNWHRLVVDAVVWTTPAALAVVAVGPHDLQQLVLPVFAFLILVLTVAAVVRFWPRQT